MMRRVYLAIALAVVSASYASAAPDGQSDPNNRADKQGYQGYQQGDRSDKDHKPPPPPPSRSGRCPGDRVDDRGDHGDGHGDHSDGHDCRDH